MALCVALCAGFTACGDDEKDETDPIPVPADRIPANAVYTTKAGNKVVVRDISGVGFTYNADGLCTQCGSVNIFYSGGLIISGDFQARFKVNEMGYMTEHDATASSKDSGSSRSQEIRSRLTYNGDGYLVKLTSESVYTEIDLTAGIDRYEEYTQESTYSWDDGKLVKMSCLQTGEVDGEKYRWSQECVMQSGGIENALGQYTIAYASMAEIVYVPSLIGLCGKAPSEFIQSIAVSESWIDSEKKEDNTGIMTFNYDFNTNGTISAETRRNSWEEGVEYVSEYSYDILGNSLLAAPAGNYVLGNPEIRKHNSWREARRARLGRR